MWSDDSMELEDGQTMMLRNESSTAIRSVLRTQSMDETARTKYSRTPSFSESEPGFEEFEVGVSERAQGTLNSSFDLSLLNSNRVSLDHSAAPIRAAASWDENETSRSDILTHLPYAYTPNSGLKAQSCSNLQDLPPPPIPRSSRKSDTPMKPRVRQPSSAIKKKLTPSSAKRPGAPLHHSRRLSPHHGSRLSSLTPVNNNSIRATAFAKSPRISSRKSKDLDVLTVMKRPSAFATRNDDFITSRELHFYDPNESTPAIANKRRPKRSLGTTTTAASTLLETTTDTIDSTETQETTTPFRFTSFPASLPRIQQAGTLQCPETVRKRMAFGNSSSVNTSHEDETNTHNTSISSLQDDTGNFGYSDDDSTDSPIGSPARTRLNFNSASSPLAMEARLGNDFDDTADFETEGNKIDLSRPYDAHRKNSFASSVSSLTKNLSACEESHTASTAGMTPSRGFSKDMLRPQTPNEVQLHFHLDAAQCSPIPGIPEEDGDASSMSGVVSSRKKRRECRPSKSGLSTSDSSGHSSLSTRPMPDMQAFGGNVMSPPPDRAADDSGVSVGTHPNSPKLLCPPTPVRTPAWANEDKKTRSIFKSGLHNRMQRSNSLITTKVLAICPPQVLDGRASLENSAIEDAKSISASNPTTSPQSMMDMLNSDDDTIVADRLSYKGENGGSLDWLHHVKSPSPRVLDSRDLNVDVDAHSVSLSTTFEILSILGKGNFADVYKVKSKTDGRLYAVKRNRLRFRGRRDREAALSEVRCMQRLQSGAFSNAEKVSNSLYLLFFYQAWQEDGHFLCQTELCCRDTCREMIDATRSNWSFAKKRYPVLQRLPPPEGFNVGQEPDLQGRLLPESVIWKVCHDISSGLSHIHSHNLVHNDIKPSNIFFEIHPRFGALCKIGDFGMTRNAGSKEDGQEGDQKYMARELLDSGVVQPSADMFSLGLTLLEMASKLTFELPAEGPIWHEIRNGQKTLEVPSTRSTELIQLTKLLISPDSNRRPAADTVLTNDTVVSAGRSPCIFLRDYIHDAEELEKNQEEEKMNAQNQNQTPRTSARPLCSPPPGALTSVALTSFCSPPAAT